MKQALCLLGLVAAVSASPTDFPAFDDNHAHCALNFDFSKTDLTNLDLTVGLKEALAVLYKGSGPAHGKYEDNGSNYVLPDLWAQATRTTPTHHYVDDILFEIKENKVDARSRSRTLSYYDFETNYCNMWNVMNIATEFADSSVDFQKDVKITPENCRWVPNNPEWRCSIY